MLRRFFLTLLSSWAATPLGVLIAHFVGVSDEPLVLLILLGMGAAAPFQIFLNECMAVTAARSRLRFSRAWLACVVVVQIGTCAAAMQFLPYRGGALIDIVLVAMLLGASTALSYDTATHYYRQVMEGTISSREAVVIGGIPGIVTLFVFVAFASASSVFGASTYWLLWMAILPTIVQWSFTRTRTSPPPASGAELMEFPVSPTLSSLTCLLTLSFMGTWLRDHIAGSDGNFTAIIVVGLNTMVSLLTTFTRALQLRRKVPRMKLALCAAGLLLCLVALLQFALVGGTLEFVLALLATQCGIIAIITAGREVAKPTVSA